METYGNCEICSSLMYEKYGSGRFCSPTCMRTNNSRSNRKNTNEKISNSLKGKPSPKKGTGTKHGINIQKICEGCKNTYAAKTSTQKMCSRECHRKYKSEASKLKSSLSALERVKNGTHQGWQSRKIRSYAEKFFETVLINNKIKFETEFKIKKRDLGLDNDASYFLDFYLPDFKIDLEIDGKQHDYPERKEQDKIRDEALHKNGFKVYRIKWKNPVNEANKEYIKNEIDKFLKYLK